MTDTSTRRGHVRRRHNWAILGSVGLLVATIVIGIWLAIIVEAPTTVTVDGEGGTILIEGPESEYVGSVTGSYAGMLVTISGMPSVDPVMESPVAWRALCAVRADQGTDWSKATSSLRGYLNSEQVDNFCAPFN